MVFSVQIEFLQSVSSNEHGQIVFREAGLCKVADRRQDVLELIDDCCDMIRGLKLKSFGMWVRIDVSWHFQSSPESLSGINDQWLGFQVLHRGLALLERP